MGLAGLPCIGDMCGKEARLEAHVFACTWCFLAPGHLRVQASLIRFIVDDEGRDIFQVQLTKIAVRALKR